MISPNAYLVLNFNLNQTCSTHFQESSFIVDVSFTADIIFTLSGLMILTHFFEITQNLIRNVIYYLARQS